MHYISSEFERKDYSQKMVKIASIWCDLDRKCNQTYVVKTEKSTRLEPGVQISITITKKKNIIGVSNDHLRRVRVIRTQGKYIIFEPSDSLRLIQGEWGMMTGGEISVEC